MAQMDELRSAHEVKHGNELRRDSLGIPSVLAVSLSFISPTIGAIFVTALIVGQSGGSAPFIFAMGAVALTLNAVTFSQFARRMPSSGILYSSVAKGIGPSTGLVQGLVLLVVYGVVSIANINLFGGFVSDVLERHAHIEIPWWVLNIAVVLVIAVLAWLSVSASMRFDLVLLAFEVLVVGILVLVIIFRGGAAGQVPAAFGPALSPTGFSGLGLGFVFVALAFFGFESCTTVAEEAKNTRRSVPIALIGSVALSGIFFVIASYAMIVGYGRDNLADLIGSSAPVSDLAGRYIGGWYEPLIDIAAVSAIGAVLLSMQNGNFRIWHSLAREQILPGVLAKVHPKYATPSAAIIGFSVVSIAGSLLAGSYWGATNAWGYLGYFCGLGILPIYLLPNIALMRFMWTKHRDEFSWLIHGVFPALSSLIMVVALIFTIFPLPEGPTRIMPFVLLAVTIAAIIFVVILRKREPERINQVGSSLFVETAETESAQAPLGKV